MSVPALTREPSSRWLQLRERMASPPSPLHPHLSNETTPSLVSSSSILNEGVVLSSSDFIPSESSCHALCGERSLRKDLDWKVLYSLIEELDISTAYKTLALIRFRRIFEHINTSYHDVQFYYNRSKSFIITASIINPALLSIATDTNTHLHLIIFWTVWAMQLLVSLVTAYVNFYKWDKKYFVYMVYKQRVEQEVWTYLELTGKYGIVNPFNPEEVESMETSHRSKIKRFLFQLETIHRKLQDTDFGIESTDADADTERIASSNHEREAKQRSVAVHAKIREVESKLKTLALESADAEAIVTAGEASGSLNREELAAIERERERRADKHEALLKELERYRALQMRNQEIDTQIQAMHSTVQGTPAKRRSSSVATTQTMASHTDTQSPVMVFPERSVPVATVHSTPKLLSRRLAATPPPSSPRVDIRVDDVPNSDAHESTTESVPTKEHV